jgi:hypothetical protein
LATQYIRRKVRKRALERWETNLANCEVTPQAIWPTAKSLTKRGEVKVPSAFHGPLGPISYPIDKANVIADCLENQFKAHDFCDGDNRRHLEAQAEALLATFDEDDPVNFRPCDVSKEIQSLKLGKACGFDGIPNRSLVHLTHLFNHCLRLGHFPAPWKENKSYLCRNPAKTLHLSKTYVGSASCLLRANYLRS